MDSIQDPSAAAEQARRRLHKEIERVRSGVEEMLTEQDDNAAIRQELAEIKTYTKKRIRKSERRTEKRLGKLERRIDQVESDRQHAEWRIHNNTEKMLDGLLSEMRAIGDLLSRTR